jgi:hypothetical protein
MTRPPDNRYRSKQQVPSLVKHAVEQRLTGERAFKAEPEHSHREHDVLVKLVASQESISAVALAPMVKHERLKVAKLGNRKVRRARCLLSLQSGNAHAHMCCLNHRNVVCSVADRHRPALWHRVSDQINKLGLLFGAHATCQHNSHTQHFLAEKCFQRFVLCYYQQGIAFNHQS